MMEKIPDLSFEIEGDVINLEQDAGCGDVDRISLHLIHLRHLAEQVGLLDPKTVDRLIAGQLMAREETIGKLVRRLHVLRRRIEHLDEFLHECSDTQHANLDYEQDYCRATSDIADEFCLEYPEPDANEPSTDRVQGVADGAATVHQTSGKTGGKSEADATSADKQAHGKPVANATAASTASQPPLI